jgi:NAD(P)-dependent dehydrogenase (short-subunit alcohol dehydrogenase family)
VRSAHVRADLLGTPIKVSVIYPGYIRSEMNAHVKAPFMVPTEKGVAAIVEAVEKEKPSAHVPRWPWVPIGFALKHLPLPVARRLMG